MVKPLTVLKMLHCRNLRLRSHKHDRQQKLVPRRSKRCSDDDDKDDFKLNETIKLETNNELCRVCLQKQGVISIHGDSTEDLSSAISTFGGIEISLSDPHPKYLCHSCNALLQGAILFRKTAQETDERLKMIVEPEPDINDHYSATNMDNEEEPTTSTEQKFSHTCTKCEIQFDSFQDYKEHKMSSEHDTKKKTCPVCNKSYAWTYYKKHMRIHTNTTYNICDICGKPFTLDCQFRAHRLTHFNSLPYKCTLCPYRGRFAASLKMHMRSHTGEKPYICDECPQRFISKSNLNKHMLTHKKERDFKCECGRGFYTKRELNLHFKVDHTGIKEHVCETCGTAFGYRKQLMKHERRVHNREKLKTGRMPMYLKLERMNQTEKQSSIVT